jgi:hypothetical protein
LWSEGHSAAMAVNEDCTSLELSLAANGAPHPITRAESFMFLEPSIIETIVDVPSDESGGTGAAGSGSNFNLGSGLGLGSLPELRFIYVGSHRTAPETTKYTTTIPTNGFNVEAVEYKNIELEAWIMAVDEQDAALPGQMKPDYKDADGVVFTLNSYDLSSISRVTTELNQLAEETISIPVAFIVANNKDSPNVATASDIKDMLQLGDTLPFQFQVFSSENLSDGLTWLAGTVAALSDRRLKHNIKLIGESSTGIPIYSFQYSDGIKLADNVVLDTKSTFVGVMGQDLLELAPHAVTKNEEDGYYRVDYSQIDVDFRKL